MTRLLVRCPHLTQAICPDSVKDHFPYLQKTESEGSRESRRPLTVSQMCGLLPLCLILTLPAPHTHPSSGREGNAEIPCESSQVKPSFLHPRACYYRQAQQWPWESQPEGTQRWPVLCTCSCNYLVGCTFCGSGSIK